MECTNHGRHRQGYIKGHILVSIIITVKITPRRISLIIHYRERSMAYGGFMIMAALLSLFLTGMVLPPVTTTTLALASYSYYYFLDDIDVKMPVSVGLAVTTQPDTQGYRYLLEFM